MKTERYGTLGGLSVACLVYATYAEADAAAGKPDAMLGNGNDSLYYRGPAADAREFIVDLLEEKTGMERKTKDSGKKDEKGNAILVFDESEGEFAKRVMAAKGWTDLKAFQPDLDRWSAAVPEYDKDGNVVKDASGKPKVAPLAVDIRERERKPAGPKKLAQKYRDVAGQLIGHKNLGRFVADYEKALGKKLAVAPSKDAAAHAKAVETLGWAVQEFSKWDAEQQEKARTAKLLG